MASETEIRTVAKAMAIAKFGYPDADWQPFHKEAKGIIAAIDALQKLRDSAAEPDQPSIGNVGTA